MKKWEDHRRERSSEIGKYPHHWVIGIPNKVEYEVTMGLTLVLGKANNRQVGVAMGSGVEMECNRELGMVTGSIVQVVCKPVTRLCAWSR